MTASDTAVGAALVTDDLSVTFGGVRALSGVGITVGPQELVAIVGPNGAGKSTLLNAISGLTRGAVRGSVSVFGTAMSGQRADRIARHGVGRSFQDPPLIDEAPVIENVLGGAHRTLGYGPIDQLVRFARVRRAEQSLRVDAMEVLELCGLADDAGKPAGSLPYGGRKLVDIARALVTRPGLVLLDEPTSGLDLDGQARVVALLEHVRADRAPAMLVVEHHMNLVRALADRAIGLQAGQVIAAGSPADVLDSGHFRAALIGGSSGTTSTAKGGA